MVSYLPPSGLVMPFDYLIIGVYLFIYFFGERGRRLPSTAEFPFLAPISHIITQSFPSLCSSSLIPAAYNSCIPHPFPSPLF